MADSNQSEVQLSLGGLEYTDAEGDKRLFTFQFNPVDLKRSRSVSMAEQPVPDKQGSAIETASAAKKFTLTADKWKVDMTVKVDAGAVHRGVPPSESTSKDKDTKYKGNAEWVKAAIEHLERLVEPIPPKAGNASGATSTLQGEPPAVLFYWGKRTWSGFVTSLTITELQFLPTLEPTRVEAAIGLTLVETKSQVAQKKTGGKASG